MAAPRNNTVQAGSVDPDCFGDRGLWPFIFVRVGFTIASIGNFDVVATGRVTLHAVGGDLHSVSNRFSAVSTWVPSDKAILARDPNS